MVIFKDMGHFKFIEISGEFSVEEIFILRQKMFKDLKGDKIVLSLGEAHLAGSSGLISLLRDLNELNRVAAAQVHLVGTKPEIKRLIKGLSLHHVRTHDTVPQAIQNCLKDSE